MYVGYYVLPVRHAHTIYFIQKSNLTEFHSVSNGAVAAVAKKKIENN